LSKQKGDQGMSELLVAVGAPPRPSPLVETVEKAQDYAAGARAEATKKVYRAAWTAFSAWCGATGRRCPRRRPR
jgi:hypothetical protein